MRGFPLLILVLAVAGAVVYFVSGTNDNTSPQLGVNSFDSCVASGNPVMESYPRQCAHEGVTYTEDLSGTEPSATDPGGRVLCKEEERGMFCTQQYQPVCGLTQVECVTTPCDPVEKTYGNACTACSEERVISYSQGRCDVL